MSALELTMKIVKENGPQGLYKGLSSTFARDVTFSVIYFPLFAYLDSLVWFVDCQEGLQLFGFRALEKQMAQAMPCSTRPFWLASCQAQLPLSPSLHSMVNSLWIRSKFINNSFEVIKTRMQTITKSAHEKTYTSIPDAFVKILKYEGPKALFKGAACRMMVCPLPSIQWISFALRWWRPCSASLKRSTTSESPRKYSESRSLLTSSSLSRSVC